MHYKYSLSFINLIVGNNWEQEGGLIAFFLGKRGFIREGVLFKEGGLMEDLWYISVNIIMR